MNTGSANSNEMPSIGMDKPPRTSDMPSGDINASSPGQMQVLVELRVPRNQGIMGARTISTMNVSSFQLDTSYEPVPISSSGEQTPSLLANEEQTLIVRGVVEESQIPELEAQPNVVKVYKDTPITPFNTALLEVDQDLVQPMDGNGSCPFGICDCSPTTPKGTIADVAKYLGVDQIWAAGYKGQGIVVGVVDGGITAEGRNVDASETTRQGPAALDPNKPDFCSVTHFQGYFNSDNGTSAATPIAAGVVALLKGAKPSLTQEEVKNVLKKTAKDIGAPGFDQDSGAGIIQPKAALDVLLPQLPKWHEWENLGGNSFSAAAAASWGNHLDIFAIGGDSAVYRKSWNGDTWSNWENLGGFSLSAPAAVGVANRIDTFIIGQQRQVLRKSWDGTCWSDWENLGGLCKQGVAVCSWGASRLDVFTIAADNSVWHKFWNGSIWSDASAKICVKGMSKLVLEISSDLAEALRVPPDERLSRVRQELALRLYQKGLLSFGKARELAQMSKWAFHELLGTEGVVRSYIYSSS